MIYSRTGTLFDYLQRRRTAAARATASSSLPAPAPSTSGPRRKINGPQLKRSAPSGFGRRAMLTATSGAPRRRPSARTSTLPGPILSIIKPSRWTKSASCSSCPRPPGPSCSRRRPWIRPTGRSTMRCATTLLRARCDPGCTASWRLPMPCSCWATGTGAAHRAEPLPCWTSTWLT